MLRNCPGCLQPQRQTCQLFENVVRGLITDTAQGHASVLLSVVSSAIHLHNQVWGRHSSEHGSALRVLQALLPLERLEGSTQQM